MSGFIVGFFLISKDSNISLNILLKVHFKNINTLKKYVAVLAKITTSVNRTNGLVGQAIRCLLLVQPIHCPGPPCASVALGTRACI